MIVGKILILVAFALLASAEAGLFRSQESQGIFGIRLGTPDDVEVLAMHDTHLAESVPIPGKALDVSFADHETLFDEAVLTFGTPEAVSPTYQQAELSHSGETSTQTGLQDYLVEGGFSLEGYVLAEEGETAANLERQLYQAAKFTCEPDPVYEALPYLLPNTLVFMDMGPGKGHIDVCLYEMLSIELPAAPVIPISGDSASIDSLLLPDLQTLPPTDLVIQYSWYWERKWLRFSNSVLNAGQGALELRGVSDPETGKTMVVQNIYTEEGDIVEVEVGEFVYHPGHNHWHFDDFARYELRSLGDNGELERLVAVNEKVGFCLRDNSPSRLPGTSFQHVYIYCGRELQGISAGWVDTYEYDIEDQTLDITDLPDGVYALRSIANPSSLLWELDESNNEAIVIIEITGLQVSVVEG